MMLQAEKLSVLIAQKLVLDQIDFEVRSDEFVALLGSNGAGKSTILRVIIGFCRKYSGIISIAGQDRRRMSQADIGAVLSYVPQFNSFPFDCPVSMLFDDLDDLHTASLLNQLNIGSFIVRSFNSLSGGEKQRVLLASALSRSPRLLLLDELTQYADTETTAFMGNFLNSYRAEFGLSVLAVSHDMKWVQQFMDRSIILHSKRIASSTEIPLLSAI